jgi:flagellar hook-basal body complex protein FliE
MSEAYEKAFQQAQTELAALDAAAEELERKRAKLRQTILVLRSMLGLETENEQSLTDAILSVLKASTDFITAPMVADRLIMAGYQVQIATVATILSRLLKDGHLKKDLENNAGYKWAGFTNFAEQLAKYPIQTQTPALFGRPRK